MDDDIAANDGSEIYNRVIVTGQTPDGTPVLVERLTDSSQPLEPVPNSSATVNTAGWTAAIGSITRDTTTLDSAPAAFKLTSSVIAIADVRSDPVPATIRKGRRYRVSLRLRRTANLNWTLTVGLVGQAAKTITQAEVLALPTGSFTTYSVDLIATQDASSYTVIVAGSTFPSAAVDLLWMDDVTVGPLEPTLVDRRGFRRAMQLPVSAALPSDGAAANQIAGTWLDAHKTTPFKGTITLTGDSSLRNILTGHDVPLEQLLLNTGQLLRFSDRTDPDTGGHGRDGRIVSVTYTPATDTAQVTIDNSRTSFDALVARLAAIQGG